MWKKNLCMVFFKSCRYVLINNIGRRRSEHWWIFTETKSVMISGISYKYRHDIWNGDAVRSSTRSFRLKWRKHIGQLEEVQTEICKFETAAGISWKDSATRVATLLTAIGNDAIDVFNTLTWGEEGDEKKNPKGTVEIWGTLWTKEKCQLWEIQILLKSPRKRRKHRPVRNDIQRALTVKYVNNERTLSSRTELCLV